MSARGNVTELQSQVSKVYQLVTFIERKTWCGGMFRDHNDLTSGTELITCGTRWCGTGWRADFLVLRVINGTLEIL